MTDLSPLGDPIGAPLAGWMAPPLPLREPLEGRFVRVEPLTAARHAPGLFAALAEDREGRLWTYRLEEPPTSLAAFTAWMERLEADAKRVWHVYLDLASGQPAGMGSLMSIVPAVGSIEVGSIIFAPALRHSPAGTEAMHLVAQQVFSLGYRRLEWTCDPLNAASMAAAARLGFRYEALFRQAYVTKKRNRDKAIFAITDADWPAVSGAQKAWLAPGNLGPDGRQIARLSDLTASLRGPDAPALAAPRRDRHGDPIGAPVENWAPRPRPEGTVLEGRLVRLEALTPAHAAALHDANRRDGEGRNWTYLPYGPFADSAGQEAWVAAHAGKPDPFFYTVIDPKHGPVGVASYLRIDPDMGSIEVGHINFSPLLQRRPGATDAMFLMMRWAFEAGYRRYEWKCDALNAPSRRAAMRLGLSYEGTFRQATIYKNRNRDTAWYAAIDSEWPRLRAAFETWLDPANFDAAGQQKQSLSDLTRPVLVARG